MTAKISRRTQHDENPVFHKVFEKQGSHGNLSGNIGLQSKAKHSRKN